MPNMIAVSQESSDDAAAAATGTRASHLLTERTPLSIA
jgi:hypothetical protein